MLRTLGVALLGFSSAVLVLVLWARFEKPKTAHVAEPRGAPIERSPQRSYAGSPDITVSPFAMDRAPATTSPSAQNVQAAGEPPGKTPEELEFELDQRFAADRPPTIESADLAKTLQTSFGTRSDVRVRSLACKETLCKVDLGFSNVGTAKGVLEELVVRGPLRQYSCGIPAEHETSDGYEVSLYVARQGEVFESDKAL